MRSLIFPFILLLTTAASCQTAPKPIRAESFSHGGYTFSTLLLPDGEIRVRVPCCQTFEADRGFKANMIEGVQQFYDCVIEEPQFSEDWVGSWQLITQCKRSSEALVSRNVIR